jgi:hypothetical protein
MQLRRINNPHTLILRGRLLLAFVTTIIAVAFTIVMTIGVDAASAQVNVLTYHNNIRRNGLNWNETILTPSKVKAGIFGKLFSLPVDGFIYAEPLYVSGLNIPGKGIHNVVFVATEHDSVYAFAAGNPNGGNPLWKKTLIDPANGITTVSSSALGCGDLVPEVGITSTPVINLTTKTLYVVSATFNSSTSEYSQQLHALDLRTGAEKFGGPVQINAAVPGTGYGDGGDTDGRGNVIFNPKLENQRAALLLSGGIVYVAFASFCDIDEYHGWVLGYDAATLKQVAAFNSTPNGQKGGIWQSGNGPATTGNGVIFVGVGNGSFDPSLQNYSESFVKLVAGSLKVVDYFTPTDQQSFSDGDLDFGIAGPLLLPPQSGSVPNELIGGGKSAVLYVLNRSNMGKYCASCNPPDPQVVQTVSSSELFAMFSTPAYWNGFVYQSSLNGPLLAFKLAKGKLSANPVAQTSVSFNDLGSTPVVSSNGPKNGIVWVLRNSNFGSPPAVLYAFRATDLTELYDTSQMAGDAAGPGVKFTVPTVVNGRVYVGTQTELVVYGMLP